MLAWFQVEINVVYRKKKKYIEDKKKKIYS